jgi:putative two-component system response regulator
VKIHIEGGEMTDKRKTIYLVDDDITNLRIGKFALTESYQVVTLNSGEKLLAMLEKKIPDLVLLDVEMPQMNGYEAMKAMKEDDRYDKIPIIFLTAKSDIKSEMEGLSLGATDYIYKPFSPPLLQKRIEVQLLIKDQKEELAHINSHLQEMVDEKTQTVAELKNAVLKTMSELVEIRDGTTGGHIDRTQSYLRILIDALYEQKLYKEIVDTWDMELIFQSAQLHDVGKIAINDGILRKPGRLSEEEFLEIKKHTTFGEQVIEKIMENTKEKKFLENAKIFAASHHEKWDGTGYPRGLKGEEIPLQGRLLAIADVYDALVSSDRPYKNAFSHEKAVKIIIDSKGSQFEPKLVDLFLSVEKEFNKLADGFGKESIRQYEEVTHGQISSYKK